MRFVGLGAVQEGMVLAHSVYDSSGRCLLNRNSTIRSKFIKRLQSSGVIGVYVYDEDVDAQVVSLLEAGTVEAAFVALKQRDYDTCTMLATTMVDTIMQNSGNLQNMTLLAQYDDDTFRHSISVATLATTVAIELGLDVQQCKYVATAGLLHDIGKQMIPKEILLKDGPLTESERELVKRHPRFGYELLQGSYTISSVVKNAVLCHHENYDGSGYPLGLVGEKISVVAQVIHVCDVYDAMVSKRVYKEDMNPADVIEFLWAGVGTMFSLRVVDAFRRCVFPYTVGIQVRLSDGCSGVVTENFKGLPLRPDVYCLQKHDTVSLRDNLSLQITAVEGIAPPHLSC